MTTPLVGERQERLQAKLLNLTTYGTATLTTKITTNTQKVRTIPIFVQARPTRPFPKELERLKKKNNLKIHGDLETIAHKHTSN